MSDYQVSYESESGYRDGKEGGTRKQGEFLIKITIQLFSSVLLKEL